jgi:hypothetical protein
MLTANRDMIGVVEVELISEHHVISCVQQSLNEWLAH